MQSLVTTNNSTVLREFNTPAFQRLGLVVLVARDGDEAFALVQQHRPGLILVDVELPGASGYDLCRRIKQSPDLVGTRVLLLLDGDITAPVIAELSASRCDEVLTTPMSTDTLLYKVTQIMGIPGRARRRMMVSMEVEVAPSGVAPRGSEVAADGVAPRGSEGGADGVAPRGSEGGADGVAHRGSEGGAGGALSGGRVVDLSQDGAGLVLDCELPKGLIVKARIGGVDEGTAVETRAEVVWSSWDEAEDGWTCGLKFLEPDLAARTALMDLSLWEVRAEPEGTQPEGTQVVTFQGDFREHTDFSRLLPRLRGRVIFDMSWVRYINSAGVRNWVSFVRGLSAVETYTFVRCSVAFVTQASMVPESTGRGDVESFMVPFACDDCELEDERLVQTSVLARQGVWPPELPSFMCPRCGGDLAFDDVPARYFAFLQP